MNEYDKKIRKQWLIMWVLSVLVNGSVGTLMQLYSPPLPGISPMVRYGMVAGSLLISLVVSVVTYRCIYRKPGTKLLTFYLILTVASFAVTPILYLTGKLSIHTHIPYYSVYLVFSQVMGFVWIFVSWRMLQLNKRLKAV